LGAPSEKSKIAPVSTTILLGGGFGGLACARALRVRAPRDHRILLIDRSPVFVVGAAKTWVMLGERRADEVMKTRAALVPEGVEWLREEVRRLDPAARRVETDRGAHVADHLVIALGAELDMAAVPGLDEAALTFYTLDGAARTHAALASFRGGRLALFVPRIPFACPPAPYEAAFLLHALLERRGIRAATQLDVWTVEKAPMGTAGPDMGRMMIGQLEARGIGFHGSKLAASVDPKSRVIRFEDGSDAGYDLLLAVPPHRVPRILVDAGLAESGGWVRVDPKTLEVRAPGVTNVYAVGDSAGVALPGRFDPGAPPLALPKAGVFAAGEGETVAAEIAARLAGGPDSAPFEGRGFCYVETGGRRAIRADGDFFAEPHPLMAAKEPTEEQFRDKVAWIESWLKPQ
jgi:sulfide:quinone oxidoreductase